jgi:hypothetical protein
MIIRRTFNEKSRATEELSTERPHPAAKNPFECIRGRQFGQLLAKPGLLEEAISQNVRRVLTTLEILNQ